MKETGKTSVRQAQQGFLNGREPLISARAIRRRLDELATAIPRRIRQRERPVAIVVLQGAFIFAADLLRRITPGYDIEVAFVRCQSYGNDSASSGKVVLTQDLDANVDLRGRTVLLIDDILDSGLTMKFLLEHLRRRGAKRVRVCVLLRRKGQPRDGRPKADFAGFDIGPEFVFGYGLDLRGSYRHLEDVWALPPERTGRRGDGVTGRKSDAGTRRRGDAEKQNRSAAPSAYDENGLL
ncbi:MAG TPA: phosphoribosyltransferase family protein [Planctomycetota bacterium]|jgi:hypoxanthine phosphoribosyltransferase